MRVHQFLEIREDPDAPLFHYTSVSALPSILDAKCLWATDIQYMNDALELRHGASTLDKILKERIPKLSGKKLKCAEQLRQWIGHDSVARHHMFVACFTEEGNLLSQWRSYCDKGKGVSLAFSPNELIETVYDQGFRLARVIYNPDEQRVVIDYLVDSFLEAAEQYDEPGPNDAHPTQSFFGLFEEWVDTITYICAMMKHTAFSQESEWRAVSLPVENLRDPRLRFRDGAISLTPYIELFLPKNGQDGVALQQVFLGPTSNHNLAFRALDTLLTSKAATPKDGILACQIPLRS